MDIPATCVGFSSLCLDEGCRHSVCVSVTECWGLSRELMSLGREYVVNHTCYLLEIQVEQLNIYCAMIFSFQAAVWMIIKGYMVKISCSVHID